MLDISRIISKHKAIRIAQKHLDENEDSRLDCTVNSDTVMERQHAFVVWYQRDRFFVTNDFNDLLIGINPYVIDRYTGEIVGRPSGSVYFWESLEKIEAQLAENYLKNLR